MYEDLPVAFLYDRLLSIINYGARWRTVVRYDKPVGIQGWFLLRERSAESHIWSSGSPDMVYMLQSTLTIHKVVREFTSFWQRLWECAEFHCRWNLTGQVSICSARDLGSEVDNANMLKGQWSTPSKFHLFSSYLLYWGNNLVLQYCWPVTDVRQWPEEGALGAKEDHLRHSLTYRHHLWLGPWSRGQAWLYWVIWRSIISKTHLPLILTIERIYWYSRSIYDKDAEDWDEAG